MTDVWMQVSSSNSITETDLSAQYADSINMIVVEVGSGRLFMTADIAGELFSQLREALNDERLAHAEKTGESAHLISAYREITVVEAGKAAERRKRLAEARRKAVA